MGPDYTRRASEGKGAGAKNPPIGPSRPFGLRLSKYSIFPAAPQARADKTQPNRENPASAREERAKPDDEPPDA